MSAGFLRRLLPRDHQDAPPPVVVVGMHRSGTSLLTGMLRDCGLYVGRRVDHLNEARYFRRINMRLLERAGADWTRLQPYLDRRGDPEFHRASCDLARAELADSFLDVFLGVERGIMAFRRRIPPWGWKDPRTCATLAVWRELFPEARWVHIVRHPLDVAISLQRREEKRRREGQPPVDESLDLGHNLALWETYVADALTLRAEEERYLEARYEELLADPRAVLSRVLEFTGLTPTAEQVAVAVRAVDATRTQRYEGDQWRPWLERAAALPPARELDYNQQCSTG